jgi:hypothetical protein
VDDLAIFANSKTEMKKSKLELSKQFKIKDLGPLSHFLGITITRDPKRKIIELSQQAYITSIVERARLEQAKPVHTPSDPNVKLAIPKENSESNFPYAQMIGMLMYAAIATRPDIAHSVQHLAQFTTRFDLSHVTAVKRVFRYLRATADTPLTYIGGPKTDTRLRAYSDADWGQDLTDRKSISGYVFLLAGGAVAWSSKKQPTVALSSMEGEYMALAHATRHAIWTRTFLSELELRTKGPTRIHTDNQAAIRFAKDHQFHGRSKHIDIRHHFVRDCIDNNIIEPVYVSTDRNLADIFTKALPRPAFTKNATRILNYA